MPTALANTLTPINANDAGAALASAYQTLTGSKPKPAVLNLLLAQWGLETGHGKAVHNFNFGNQKSSSGDEYYQEFEAGEIVDGQEQKSVMHFAAYKDIDSGALAYVKILQRRPQWWAGLQSGDPHTFVSGLVAVPGQHYFTADPSRYLKTLSDELPKFAAIAKKYGKSRFAWVATALGMLLGAGVVVAYHRHQSSVISHQSSVVSHQSDRKQITENRELS